MLFPRDRKFHVATGRKYRITVDVLDIRIIKQRSTIFFVNRAVQT